MATSFFERKVCLALGFSLLYGLTGAGQGEARAEVGAPDAASGPATEPVLAQPSSVGSIGLFETSTAEVGPRHQLRLGLRAAYFTANDLLIAGDSNQRLRGGVVFGFTPLRQVEIFGALLNASNRNQRTRAPTDQDPEVIKSFGDLVLGAKAIHPLSPEVTVGFELGFRVLAGVSELALAPRSTSFWLGPLLTYDLRQRPRPLPLRLHAATSFYVDNSDQVQDLSNVTRATRYVAMFGYGMARSRLRLGLAADAPLPAGKAGPFALDPFVEYHVEYVTSTADPAFADYTGPGCGVMPGTSGCVDNRDAQWLTLGVRAAVFRQLTVELGTDVRVRSPGYPYGVPVPPFDVMIGVSMPFDVDHLMGANVAAKPVEPPRATTGFLTGQVRSSVGGAPVPDAIVTVVGRAHSRVASDGDGGFTTLNLPPGPVELDVSAPNFEPLKVVTTVNAARPADVVVTMRPRAPVATVHGRVAGREGQGLEATLKFSGKGKGTDGNFEARADATGTYSLTLPAGAYRVRAEAPALPAREADLQLVVGDDRALDFVLRPAPSSPNVTLAGEAIRTRQAIRFSGVTATLLPASARLLDAVAELLDAHAEIRRVQIMAHWDNAPLKDGTPEALTLAQAEAVKAYLVTRGISGDRLVTVGAGASKPMVPNLDPASRTRNRRVEFHLE